MSNQETPGIGIGIVFGGGNGIGAACCRLMRERGWQVAVADFDEDGAQAVAREVDGLALRVDVRDAAAVTRAADDVEARLGIPSGLVMSAGTFQDNQPIDDTPPDALERILSVNFAGTHHVNRVFGLRMAALGRLSADRAQIHAMDLGRGGRTRRYRGVRAIHDLCRAHAASF